jgi:hypothetical protein
MHLFYCRAYSVKREVVAMVVRINSKPIKVKEDEEREFSWVYFMVTCVGYGLILWILRVAAVTFLGWY